MEVNGHSASELFSFRVNGPAISRLDIFFAFVVTLIVILLREFFRLYLAVLAPG